MKKIYAAAAAFIAVSSMITVFSACNSKTEVTNGTQSVTPAGVLTDVNGTAYSLGDDGYKYVITTQPAHEDKANKNQSMGHTIITVPPAEKTTKKVNETEKQSFLEKTTAAKTNISSETVKNESKGISVLLKSDAVPRGSSATITIMGETDKTYSIEFYKNNSTVSTANGLGSVKADKNGMVTWTFEVESDCEPGNRKVIIREKGSDKFVQTSINIK